MGENAARDGRIERLALIAADTARAQEAAEHLRETCHFVSASEAQAVVVLGGDGTMLDTMHRMIDEGVVLPVYGINLGTVGFLMNRYKRNSRLLERVAKAK